MNASRIPGSSPSLPESQFKGLTWKSTFVVPLALYGVLTVFIELVREKLTPMIERLRK